MTTHKLNDLLESQRAFFGSGQTRSLNFRRQALKALERGISLMEGEIIDALAQDLGKPPAESVATETGLVQADIRYMLKNLDRLARPHRVPAPFAFPGSSASIWPQALGVVLIMSPWNYPFQLLMRPLVGALAAGNCAVLKPSDQASHTSAIARQLVEGIFRPEHVALLEGGAETGRLLLQQKFDGIFFTGNSREGREVMRSAAENLTPVVLELGGKCPCLVDRDVNLTRCARRIAWGKFINAGQTCVAPDYLLVDRQVKDRLVQELTAAIVEFYGPDPKKSPDYARIINKHHFNRLLELMNEGRIIQGGQTDQEALYIAPTLFDGVSWDSPIMQEEIFGPLLPVLEYDSLDQALQAINSRPRPLALYLFSKDRANQQKIIAETCSGGVCINDTVSHMLPDRLPFGGVGESGMGAYHGDSSFLCFSHQKSVFKNPLHFDLKIKYPPYRMSLSSLKRLLRLIH